MWSMVWKLRVALSILGGICVVNLYGWINGRLFREMFGSIDRYDDGGGDSNGVY